jgi:hypothetical protein
MEDSAWTGGIAPTHFYLDTRWVSGQRHAPATIWPRGKDPLYRKLGGPQSRSEHRGLRKNPLPGIEPLWLSSYWTYRHSIFNQGKGGRERENAKGYGGL